VGFRVLSRLKQAVNGQLEGIAKHAGYQFCKQRAGALNAGVFVDFNQPYLPFCIDNKIESKYLKAVPFIIIIYLFLDRTESHISNLFNSTPNEFHRLL
jgi:hypothetical protein